MATIMVFGLLPCRMNKKRENGRVKKDYLYKRIDLEDHMNRSRLVSYEAQTGVDLLHEEMESLSRNLSEYMDCSLFLAKYV